jgi:hypothetical protein
MGGRYFITGVQIGMIRAFAKLENDADINKVLDEIEDNQYLCEKEEFEKSQKKEKKPKKINQIRRK